MKHRPIAQKT